MRYFFLTLSIVAVMVVGIFGFRGQHFSERPIRIFPDMDEQDKLKAQKPDDFFADGVGSRLPVAGTQPLGLNEEGKAMEAGIPSAEFSGTETYYDTGRNGKYYGQGMPKKLGLSEQSVAVFLKRGQECFEISCMPCHGKAGDGAGITSYFGVPGAANLHLPPFLAVSYPDGKLFETITKGKGNMSGYGYNVSVQDRWAIVAYVRALQAAQSMPYEQVQQVFDAAKAAGKVIK